MRVDSNPRETLADFGHLPQNPLDKRACKIRWTPTLDKRAYKIRWTPTLDKRACKIRWTSSPPAGPIGFAGPLHHAYWLARIYYNSPRRNGWMPQRADSFLIRLITSSLSV